VFATVHDDSAVAARGLATGALGYVLKLAAGDELVPAVEAALRGERYVTDGAWARADDPSANR
jgi:DNA-binding NarL/FixJ family response regulator